MTQSELVPATGARSIAGPRAGRGPAADAALLLFRLYVGGFLIWGVLDNIVSSTRMDEFVRFLSGHGFPIPAVAARISVIAQLACGLSFVTGLLVRFFGALCAVNFIVALVMVDLALGVRGSFPAMMLVLFGAYVALSGAGAYSADALLARRRAASE